MKAGTSSLEGLRLVFSKEAQKNLMGASESGGQWVRFKKKRDSFTFETLKNHLIRNFLRNGRVRVNILKIYISNNLI